jgi:hypothetical protein
VWSVGRDSLLNAAFPTNNFLLPIISIFIELYGELVEGIKIGESNKYE